ncbi:6-phosphofructokinase [Algisphaera agarilytica]|uniref:ATP-dependent 6-phosphofructokinase n=1 Tax=Algisphaera agarilytica TaxID=1385975 RepID=A0A7X0H816_9BACT|nr:ATP-dependent 6-phosphofructokinase [Algisphaera agarilytica]MBB6431000.1 6-phosphofructokinase 1 [Algisphaera agarilytica]
MSRNLGILTSGGDCPGLNAAIRGVCKPAINRFDFQAIGFRDGFRGLMQDRTLRLEDELLSGILTQGGTILGTSRDKPNKMPVGDQVLDMTNVMVETYDRHHLDALICLGGGGTQKNAKLLMDKGLNVITLPKTIDNDVGLTDITFGFDTALEIATDAIDKLHSTATSHHRIIVVEIMGHRAGWLALGAGVAGGADVVLIPEIPYDLERVAEAIKKRTKSGKRFSIVAVAEGAMSTKEHAEFAAAKKRKQEAPDKETKQKIKAELASLDRARGDHTVHLTHLLEELVGMEARLTILGHLQRGGTPSAADRLLATQLGTKAAECLNEEQFGVMIAARGHDAVPVPLTEVAGNRKLVPLDHPWLETARRVGTCLGDESAAPSHNRSLSI